MSTLFKNGHLITPYGIWPNASLWEEEGVIKKISPILIEAPDAVQVDAKGMYISPGFIDLHVHGGGGADFMDGTVEAFLQVATTHLQHGTTAMMPTTLTADQEQLDAILGIYPVAQKANRCGAAFLGMHVEGPYFAEAHRGAQDPRYLRLPNPQEYQNLLNKHPYVARWSVAPELEGALEMGLYLQKKKVLASIAHTDAIFEDIEKALNHGYTLVTHLYSAMNGVIRRNAYRHAGTVEAAFWFDELDVEVIADGRHLPKSLLQLVHKIKGKQKIALITDAMRAAGTVVRESILGSKQDGIAVIIEDEVAKLPDRSSFAGSTATFDRLVQFVWKEVGISLLDTITMASLTPARIARVEAHKGSLDVGKDADILIFDENVQIQQVFIRGRKVV